MQPATGGRPSGRDEPTFGDWDFMLKMLKRATLRATERCGISALPRDSEWRRKRLLIIGYHGVSIDDEHDWDPAFYMAPTTFEQRLRALRDGGYRVLPLGEALARLANGSLASRSVALTFDDGMADFAIVAAPLLAKYGFPATVYLTTYHSRFNRPIFGLLCSYVLWKTPRARLAAAEVLDDRPGTVWDLTTPTGRSAALRDITEYATRHRLSAREKDDLGHRLTDAAALDFDALRERRMLHILSPDEVRRLSAAGIDFELHTHRHCTPSDRTGFLREVEENRAEITAMTGAVPRAFCYPSGIYWPELARWLRECGVSSATTCDTGIASPRSDPMFLPRLIDTSNLSRLEFESWLTGLGALLPRRRHRATTR